MRQRKQLRAFWPEHTRIGRNTDRTLDLNFYVRGPHPKTK